MPGNNIHGIYGSIPDRRGKFTVEPYALWRLSPAWRMEGGGFGRLDVKYPGAHVFGKVGAFDYDTEIAAEVGHSGTDRVRAWAGHWRAGYAGRAGPMGAHWIAEYNHASQIGWKNIHRVRTGVEPALGRGWQLIPNIHNYWLASRMDGLFTPSNTELAVVEGDAHSNRVGWEADLSAVWSITKLLEAGIGYTRLFPGAFLREATQGVAYNYGYCQLNYRF